MKLIPKNWRDFQHYKDRSPPWIRLHRKLLDDKDFHRLPVDARALAPMLWLLASESVDGIINADVDDLAFRLRTTELAIRKGLDPLLERGFFVVEQDASNAIATCQHDATPETEALQRTETEAETENPARAPRKSSSNLEPQDLVAEGVELQHAKDWRNARKSPITPTAWDELKKQAAIAGIPPGEAVRICAAKGWRGFDASWKWQGNARASTSSQNSTTAEAARLLGFLDDEVIDA